MRAGWRCARSRPICRRCTARGVSPSLISSVTDAVMDEVKTWQSRPPDAVYPIVYMDCLHVKVREGAVRVRILGPSALIRFFRESGTEHRPGVASRFVAVRRPSPRMPSIESDTNELSPASESHPGELLWGTL